MNNLAIIPARSGSKGLKDKNIRLLNNKPVIAYSIEAARNSGLFNTIMVSTDSLEYANIAKSLGAEIPFLRSADNSSDQASSWDVVREVLEHYSRDNIHFDMFTLLQPTSPLRTAGDINNAFEIYIEKKANAVISVCEMEHSPLWSNTLPDNHSMDSFINKDNDQRRQQLDTYYRLNGAIYMVRTQYFCNVKSIYEKESYAYIMPSSHSVDIDSLIDLKLAEAILKDRMLYEELL